LGFGQPVHGQAAGEADDNDIGGGGIESDVAHVRQVRERAFEVCMCLSSVDFLARVCHLKCTHVCIELLRTDQHTKASTGNPLMQICH